MNDFSALAELTIDEFIATLETTPQDRAAMADARRWLAAGLEQEEGMTLRFLRLRAGLSQMNLAQAVGLSECRLTSIEVGHRRPTIETAEKLAHILGVTVQAIYAAFSSLKK